MDHEMQTLICELYRSGGLKKVIRPFRMSDNPETDWELKKDLEQELVLILMDYKDKEKLITMHKRNKNELIRFLIRIVKNNVCSETSPFWKKYGIWEYKRKTFKLKEHEI